MSAGEETVKRQFDKPLKLTVVRFEICSARTPHSFDWERVTVVSRPHERRFKEVQERHSHIVVSIYFMHCNFTRIHRALKVTAAMFASVSDKFGKYLI